MNRVRQEVARQPRWLPGVMLASAACTFASLLANDPSGRFGGPVLSFAALCGSGALLVLSIVVLVTRRRTSPDDREGNRSRRS